MKQAIATRTPIKVIQYSPFWDEEITVMSGYHEEDGEFVLEYCNHAGATVEDMTAYEHTMYEREIGVKVCNKPLCGKMYNELTGEWE